MSACLLLSLCVSLSLDRTVHPRTQLNDAVKHGGTVVGCQLILKLVITQAMKESIVLGLLILVALEGLGVKVTGGVEPFVREGLHALGSPG